MREGGSLALPPSLLSLFEVVEQKKGETTEDTRRARFAVRLAAVARRVPVRAGPVGSRHRSCYG